MNNKENPLNMPKGSVRALAFLFTTFCCLIVLPVMSKWLGIADTYGTLACQTWGIMVGYYFGKRDHEEKKDEKPPQPSLN